MYSYFYKKMKLIDNCNCDQHRKYRKHLVHRAKKTARNKIKVLLRTLPGEDE